MDETVLITGCSSGIGRETALSFLADGWEVYATARNPADIETLGEKGCHISTLDVTDDDHVERVIDEIIDEHGHLDCLVNNAGYAQPGPVEDVPIEQVHAQFDVNVYGPLRLARAALSHMRERGKGTIINVSSAVGRVAVPGMGIYSGSKFALEGDVGLASRRSRGVRRRRRAGRTRSGRHRVLRPSASDEVEGVERSGGYERFYEMYGDRQAIDGGMPGAVHPEGGRRHNPRRRERPTPGRPVSGRNGRPPDRLRANPSRGMARQTVRDGFGASTNDWVKKFFD